MVSVLIYLFESGMCLTLLFLVYFLFLRKETYFTFNRIYLLSIIVLSFLLPLLHLKFTVPQSENLKHRISEVNKVKNYYENLIALTDPEYNISFTKSFNKTQENNFEDGTTFPIRHDGNISETNNAKLKDYFKTVNWSLVLLTLYLLGMLFFILRLLLLFQWLSQTVKKYGLNNKHGVNLISMDEEVPPFSFFRFVFLHKETLSHPGLSQILAHEHVHIRQRHSYDLLLAHALTIFQWFNPFAWLINHAMKTNHEYIADRNVVDQGYELFDYQSLLLKQIISIRSVELVNNFNLINIKKRIAMMTKIKSGFVAQLKALVIIPAAIFMFFFFSEISFAQVDASSQQKIGLSNLTGFWKNESENTYGQLLYFKDKTLQILEDKNSYQEFEFHIPESASPIPESYFRESKISDYVRSKDELSSINVLAVKTHGGTLGNKPLYCAIKNNKLIVEWSKTQVSIYTRTKLNNSLEEYSGMIANDFELVKNEYYRLAENPERTFHILMNWKGNMMLNNERLVLDDLEEKLLAMKANDNPFASSTKIVILVVDARCQMKYVYKLYKKLRESNQLLHILSVKPFDQKVPEVFYHNVGIPRLLPPIDGKFMEIEEMEKNGMHIISIDLTKSITPEKAASLFKKEIQKDKKFVVVFRYENETLYKDYLSILDKFYLDIFSKRNNLAKDIYNLPYDDLAKAQQKEIRKSFPMVLTERNVDQPD